jgi:hypothetical protein
VGGATRRKEEGVWLSATWRGGEWGSTSGSCTRAAETGAGRAVSGVVRKQGSGRCAWAARERVGRPGEGRSWTGPKSNSADFLFKRNFQTIHDLI